MAKIILIRAAPGKVIIYLGISDIGEDFKKYRRKLRDKTDLELYLESFVGEPLERTG